MDEPLKPKATPFFLELAGRRESTRCFSDCPVRREQVELCLEAARLAPSACNSQPWSFTVVDEPELKRRLAETAFSGIWSMNAFAREAPVLVVMTTEPSTTSARLGGLFKRVRYNLIDIGIAGEHLVMQAAELGIATCWLGWFHEKGVRRMLNLPRRSRIDIIIALGFPAPEETPREKKRKDFNQIVRYNLGEKKD